jgi:hypothetical protein
MQQDIDASIDKIADVVETFPERSPTRATVVTLKKQYEEERKLYKMIKDDTLGLATSGAGKNEVMMSGGLELLLDSQRLNSEIQRDSASVLKELDERTQIDKAFYDAFTWISYGLYALGWTLGFLGQVYEVKLAAGTE